MLLGLVGCGVVPGPAVVSLDLAGSPAIATVRAPDDALSLWLRYDFVHGHGLHLGPAKVWVGQEDWAIRGSVTTTVDGTLTQTLQVDWDGSDDPPVVGRSTNWSVGVDDAMAATQWRAHGEVWLTDLDGLAPDAEVEIASDLRLDPAVPDAQLFVDLTN